MAQIFIHCGASWGPVLGEAIRVPFVGRVSSSDADLYEQLTLAKNFFCIDLFDDVGGFSNHLSTIMPFVWLRGYLKISEIPVFAGYNTDLRHSQEYLSVISAEIKKHGYDSFFWLTYYEEAGTLRLYQNGQGFDHTNRLIESVVVTTHRSSDSIFLTLKKAEEQWLNFLYQFDPTVEELSFIVEQLEEGRTRQREVILARTAFTTFRKQILQLQSGSDAAEIQRHYDRVYENMPLWYRKMGGLIRKMGITRSR